METYFENLTAREGTGEKLIADLKDKAPEVRTRGGYIDY